MDIGMPGRDFVVDVIGCGEPLLGKATLYGLSGDGTYIPHFGFWIWYFYSYRFC
jgi:hypothetical protein